MSAARVLRDAGVADAPGMCAAEQAVAAGFEGRLVSLPSELEAEAFAERIRLVPQGRAKVLVAEVDGCRVGHGSLWTRPLVQAAHVAHLDLCVHVGHWRQGHGEALLQALLAWAGGQELRKVELQVRAENRGAIALYRKFGFVEEGRLRARVRLVSGRFVDDLVMGRLFD